MKHFTLITQIRQKYENIGSEKILFSQKQAIKYIKK